MERFEQLAFESKPGDISADLNLNATARTLDAFVSPNYSPYMNSFLGAFVKAARTDEELQVETPFCEAVGAGKNTYVYDAHTYHTKVPPEAITEMLEHYTRPGDLVLDPFCGSGMTGVAALRTNRKPILSDLSPAATFIAHNFSNPVSARAYFNAIKAILASLSAEELFLFGTHCRTCRKLVPMEYLVWSYGLVCEFCRHEFVLWDIARDERANIRESKILGEFPCPNCNKMVEKRRLKRTRPYPVQVGYRCCDSRQKESQAVPDAFDLGAIQRIQEQGIPQELWYPTVALPEGVNTRQAIAHGFQTVDSLYTLRGLWAVARLWDIARRWSDADIGLKLMFTVTSLYQRVTRLSEFRFWGGSGNIANYNVPMIFNEQNVFKVFWRKAKTIRDYFETLKDESKSVVCISTQSATDLSNLPNNSIDYVFTDPPFGSNINYSEMNFLWEAWLGAYTDTTNEAIINRAQGKTAQDYQNLMTAALKEIQRVLKPGHWLTLVFHNSSAQVWAALQTAIADSGFVVASIQTLDKRHGTFKQFVSENAVGYDLMIHCVKGSSAQPITVLAPSHSETELKRQVNAFLERTLKKHPEDYVVQYLHVERKNEMDSRKLYSLWLIEQMAQQAQIDLDYSTFRELVVAYSQRELVNPSLFDTE